MVLSHVSWLLLIAALVAKVVFGAPNASERGVAVDAWRAYMLESAFMGMSLENY